MSDAFSDAPRPDPAAQPDDLGVEVCRVVGKALTLLETGRINIRPDSTYAAEQLLTDFVRDLYGRLPKGQQTVLRADPRGAALPTALTELDVVGAWLSDLWLLAHRRDLPPDVQQQIERDVHHIRDLLSREAPPAGPSPDAPLIVGEHHRDASSYSPQIPEGHTLEGGLLVRAGPSPEPDGCPCTLVEPCSENCTCAHSVMSGGCTRCCKYGSDEQRLAAARDLASRLDGVRASQQSGPTPELDGCDFLPEPGHSQQHSLGCRSYRTAAKCICGKYLYDGHIESLRGASPSGRPPEEAK